jgi:hypothetical protein
MDLCSANLGGGNGSAAEAPLGNGFVARHFAVQSHEPPMVGFG